MPTINLSIPSISEEDLTSKKATKRILNYLGMLDENLRYVLGHLSSEENFDQDTLNRMYSEEGKTAKLIFDVNGLTVRVEDTEDGVAQLVIRAGLIESTVTNVEKNLSSKITQTAGQIRQEVSDTAKGLESNITQTAGQIRQEVSNTAAGLDSKISQTAGQIRQEVTNTAKGLESKIVQEAGRVTTQVNNYTDGKVSQVQQTADKINWIVADGTSASNFSLTSRVANLVADEINIDGLVTFNDLEREGRTIIHGGNIETGTLDVKQITSDRENVFDRSGNLLTIGYGMSGKSELLLGTDRVLVCNYDTVLAFFGATGNERLNVHGVGDSDDLSAIRRKLGILIDTLDSYGLINMV